MRFTAFVYFNEANRGFAGVVTPGGVTLLGTGVSQDIDMVTLRLNYRFGGYTAPVAARYQSTSGTQQLGPGFRPGPSLFVARLTHAASRCAAMEVDARASEWQRKNGHVLALACPAPQFFLQVS